MPGKHAPIIRLLALSFTCLAFAGCGGELNSPSGFLTRAVGFDVTWGPKITKASRADSPPIHAPAEAQSAEMFLVGANQDGSEYKQVILRDTAQAGAYTDSYGVNNPVRTGGTLFRAKFYITPVPTNNPDDLIGEIKPTPLLINTTGPTDILVSAITVPTAVIITPGQTLRVGQTSPVKYSILDDKQNLVVQSTSNTITPTALAILSGSGSIVDVVSLPPADNQLKGKGQGSAQITATIYFAKIVNGKVELGNLVSKPEAISVVTTGVSLTPTDANVLTRGTQQFSAIVTNDDLFNSGVTWTVDSAGGTIDNTGLYQASDLAGTYQVVATSKADPTQNAKATVHVTAPAHSGGAGFIIK